MRTNAILIVVLAAFLSTGCGNSSCKNTPDLVVAGLETYRTNSLAAAYKVWANGGPLEFGATDALGWTDTSQLQGAEYIGSRILATVSRESLIGAATFGSFQLAQTGSEAALYTYQGLQVVNAGRSGWAIGTGIDQVSEGNNWGYLQIAGGSLGLAGGFTMTAVAPELNAGVQTMRQGVAQNFYYAAGFSEADTASHLQGIDFSQPVRVTTLQDGTTVVQYQYPGRSTGNYFAPEGTPANTLGINPAGRVPNFYDVNQPVTVLQSTAADTTGLPSVPAHVQGTGGGTQFFTTQPGAFTPR